MAARHKRERGAVSEERKRGADSSNQWVYGLYNNRPRNNSKISPIKQKNREEKTQNLLSRLSGRSLLVIVIISLLFLLLWIPFINIDCQDQKQQACSQDLRYRDIVNQSYPIFLRISPLFDNQEVAQSLSQEITVSSATVDNHLLNSRKITIIERADFAIWQNINSTDAIIAIDRQGIAYRNVDISTDDIDNLVTFKDTIIENPELGEALVETETLNYVLALKSDPGLLPGYLIEEVIITDVIKEFTLVLTEVDTTDTIEVKMTTLRPLEEQVIDIRLTTDYLEAGDIDYEYIDVRLESNTVYQ